jgi:diguanylate cyclase (GGDEF)-like protein
MFATAFHVRGEMSSAPAFERRHSALFAYAVLGVLLLAYVVYVIVRPDGMSSTAIDGWGIDAFELTAGALCLLAGLSRRPRGVVPLVLGAALVSWGMGDTVLTIESLGGATPPTPSLADVFYLSFFPLSYFAVGTFIRGETRHLTSPNWLDGLVAGLGAASVLAAFAFSAIEQTANESALGVGVNLAYPVGDILLLLLVAAGTAVMSGRRKAPWLLLAAGFSINVFGDTANLLHHGLGGTHVGTVIDAIAWPISILLMSLAMWLRQGLADPLAVQQPPGFLLPGLAAAAGLVVLFLSTIVSIDHVASGLAAATLLLVVVRTVQSFREMQAQSRERHVQSVTDHLTGLANRRRLFGVLESVFAEPPESQPQIGFLFIDLNGFKRINDSFGHPAGDEVLEQVAVRLRGALRPADLLARVGGDEFVALILDAAEDEAMVVAERLSACLNEPFAVDTVAARIGASVGIALAPSHARDGDGLLRCADTAMYRAKLTGARYALYESDVDRGGDKLRLADELSAAIDHGHLVLHYQPQLDLRTERTSTVEALVRWRHPDHGLIAPMTFLPLAEEAGLMPKLTAWVLDEALRQCAAWEAGGRSVQVSVNVSAKELVAPGFAEQVADRLAFHSLAPKRLMLEITETSIIEEFERARHAVARLRELGVAVSIDDFGAGFTSLAYLSRLPVAQLKLDSSLISPLERGTNTRDAELVRATIELGHSLGMHVVAEGVEDDRVLSLLRVLGCDIGQGFGIGRPVPAEELGFQRDSGMLAPAGATADPRGRAVAAHGPA